MFAKHPGQKTGLDMKAPDDQESVLARYMDGLALLDRALDGIQESELDVPPSQGGWTIRQIVHHLADGDDIWKAGIKMALGNEEAEVSLEWYRKHPQEVWARKWAYEKRSVDVSLALLRAIRSHVHQLLTHVPDGWYRSIAFRNPDGETERVPVGFIVEMQADHVEHHVKQVHRIRSEVGGG